MSLDQYSKSISLYQTIQFLGQPRVKASADNKINVTKNLKFVLERVENIVGKGGNTGSLFFSFSLEF